MSNKEELLKKIKALADRGVDGERENAQAILYRLMEQYGISEAEIEEDRRETAWFSYSQETERRLLNQIIYMVTGKSAFGCVGAYTNRKRKKMGADCTAAERMDKLEDVEDSEEETPEKLARAMKIGAMMDGMERHTLRKAITAGGDPQEGGGA